MKQGPYLLYLAAMLALLGGLALFQVRSTNDSTTASGAVETETEPSGVDVVATAPDIAGGSAAPQPIRSALPMPPTLQLESVDFRFEQAIDIGRLTGMVWNGQEDAYFAIAQTGTVYRIDRELTDFEVTLDLTAETSEIEGGSELGMLGIAFDPRDGRMFLYLTDRSNDTNVISMAMRDGAPDPATRRQVLFIEQPGLGHKAGDLQFDAAGNLFVAVGDGGGSQGRDAQDGSKLLGKILRIVPRLDGDGYDIPTDNPFVDRPDISDEIWAMGLRNPWQFHLDEPTGDMYIGDVGESDVEEIDLIPAGTSGQNFGWYWYEGSTDRQIGGQPAGVEFTDPIHEYQHTLGPAVIGGRIYYGSQLPELRGAYVFADMTGPMFAMGADGVVRLDTNGSGVVTSFLESPEGEFLVTTLTEGVLRILPD